jgi:hypothetical protein
MGPSTNSTVSRQSRESFGKTASRWCRSCRVRRRQSRGSAHGQPDISPARCHALLPADRSRCEGGAAWRRFRLRELHHGLISGMQINVRHDRRAPKVFIGDTTAANRLPAHQPASAGDGYAPRGACRRLA